MKTIVIGLGNPILGDDGVGWVVAEEMMNQLPPDLDVDVDRLSLAASASWNGSLDMTAPS